jgi:fido (protein-threonine AMPylation protein)
MSGYEVPEPILNSPFEEPQEHWHIVEGETPERRPGRRPAMYFYRDPKAKPDTEAGRVVGTAIELTLVNRIRAQVKRWRLDGYPGVTRTTLELLQWWRRDGRAQRLFFAQLDAAETIIFLAEARADFRQGIEVPQEAVSDEKRNDGFAGFLRYACKMATGSGKTTVMGMLAAWSILNKVNDRSDARFSDVVLIVCPNVTIKNRLRELDPEEGEASLYRTRDLMPSHLMPLLTQGRVLKNLLHVIGKREMDRMEGREQVRALEELANSYEDNHRFTAADICHIHQCWLGQIYSWAGKYRQVNVKKGAFSFAAAAQIPVLMTELEEGPLRRHTPCRFASIEMIAAALAEVHVELVLIHPFREGNGRVARILAVLMGLQAGLPPLYFDRLSGRKRPQYFAAVRAGLDRNYDPMRELFSVVIQRTLQVHEKR